ncbi:MAG: copper transporter [Actinomycetota bacterium]|nr:copper transporter [Actinomycetota bacterium]
MINLRYHIVSVVAVFLALGIGLALGSTFVDSILVNELEDQVNEFKLDRDEAIRVKDQAVDDKNRSQEEIEVLQAEGVQQSQRHQEQLKDIRASSEEEVDAIRGQREMDRSANNVLLNSIENMMPRGRLAGTSWVMLAPTGVDRLVMSEIREVLTRSDGEYLGTLWIRPAMNFEDPETASALTEMFALESQSVPVSEVTIARLAASLLMEEEATNNETESTNDVISRLSDLGLMRFDRYQSAVTIDELSNAANRIIFVNDIEHIDLHQGFIVPLIEEITNRRGDGVGAVIELQNEDSTRGQVVDRIRNDSNLAKAWSTFDDVDSLEDRLGLLVGLSRLPVVGHYGELPTAEERFPR